ncbi:MAG: tetratricopeptide repeat protein, partial [Longimicrobiales bacterium]
RALAIQEANFGPDHLKTASALMNLGLLCQSEGDYQGAYDRYRRALEIQEAALGPTSSVVASTLGNLGFLLRSVEEYEEAEEVLRRSLRIQEEALGPDNPELLPVLTNLGFLYRDLRRVEESVDFYKRAIEIIEASYPEPGVRLGTQYVYLAGPLNDDGQYQDALRAAQEGMRYASQAPGEDLDLRYLGTWETGRARFGLGEVAAADSLFGLALDLVREDEGKEGPRFAEAQAGVWALKGDRDRSLEWFKEAIRQGSRTTWLLRNPELDIIRDHPDYPRLAAQIRVVLHR